MKNIFVIYDKKSELLRSLFLGDHEVGAIRGTIGAAMQEGSDLANYPDDFELRNIGEIDTRTMEITMRDVPKLIGTVSTMLAASKAKN